MNCKASKNFNKGVVSQKPHQEPKREDLCMVLIRVIDYIHIQQADTGFKKVVLV